MRRTFAIVGASATGATAAAALREEGFDGRVILIGEDPEPPYERPPLSKEFLRGEQDLEKGFIRSREFYADNDIETRFGQRADRLDPTTRTVVMADGESIGYDAALISTGSRNRRISTAGADLANVFQLRTAADSRAIRKAAKDASRAVIVGFGFVGSELAASFRIMGIEVAVVEHGATALQRVLGARFGRVLEAMHRDRGVEIFFEDSAERFDGDGRFEAVTTKTGRRIEGDLVVVGIGTEPNVEIVAGTDIATDRGILADPSLRTNAPDVFVAGDVANHEHPIFGRIRVEHLDNAQKMGPAAARNMLGAETVFDDPHWFWSDQYDSMIQMGGYTLDWNDAIIRGNVAERSFCAFKLSQGGSLLASLSIDWPRDVRRSLPMIGRPIDPKALADPEVDLRELARTT